MNDTKLRGYSDHLLRRGIGDHLVTAFERTDKHGTPISYYSPKKLPKGVKRFTICIENNYYNTMMTFIAVKADDGVWLRRCSYSKRDMFKGQDSSRPKAAGDEIALAGYRALDSIPAAVIRKLFNDDMAYHDRRFARESVIKRTGVAKLGLNSANENDSPTRLYDSLAAHFRGGSFKCLDSVETINDLCEGLFGKNKRFYRVSLIRMVSIFGNLALSHIINAIRLADAYDSAIKYDIIEAFIESMVLPSVGYGVNTIDGVKDAISGKRLRNFILNTKDDNDGSYNYYRRTLPNGRTYILNNELMDCVSMHNEMTGKGIDVDDLLGNYNSIKEWHDKLVPLRKLLRNENVDFTFNESIREALEGVMGVSLPADSATVEGWGAKQNHCIGGYARDMGDNFILVQITTETQVSHAQVYYYDYREQGNMWHLGQHYTAHNRHPHADNVEVANDMLIALNKLELPEGATPATRTVNKLSIEEIKERLATAA